MAILRNVFIVFFALMAGLNVFWSFSFVAAVIGWVPSSIGDEMGAPIKLGRRVNNNFSSLAEIQIYSPPASQERRAPVTDLKPAGEEQ